MRICLFINPNAGRKKALKQLPEIQRKLAYLNIDADFHITKSTGQLMKLVQQLNPCDFDAWIAMGGDGSNFFLLNAAMSAFPYEDIPPLGILPIGSGNSFCADLNVVTVDDALRAIHQNRPVPVDVCSFSHGSQTCYFVNLLGLGFVTDVTRTADRFKICCDAAYLIGVLHRTLNLKFNDLELVIDGRKHSGRYCFAEFCNSRYTGGKMLMAPDAKIDDGLMDVVLTGPLTRTDLLMTLPKIFSGEHIHHPAVHYFKARDIEIRSRKKLRLLPDGEIFSSTPTRIQIQPKLIRYLACR